MNIEFKLKVKDKIKLRNFSIYKKMKLLLLFFTFMTKFLQINSYNPGENFNNIINNTNVLINNGVQLEPLKINFIRSFNLGSICGKEINFDKQTLNQTILSAELADLSYNDYNVGEVLIVEDQNFTVESVIKIKASFLTYFFAYILINDDNYYVVIRGSYNIYQIITDIRIIPYTEQFTMSTVNSKDISTLGNNITFEIEMYRGMCISVNSNSNKSEKSPAYVIMDELDRLISKRNNSKIPSLNFIGHSLGASQINTFLCYYFSNSFQEQYPKLSYNKFSSINVNLFGCPKVTNNAGYKILFSFLRKNYPNFNYYSFINCQDIIAHGDLSIFSDIKHISEDQYLLEVISNKIYLIKSDLLDKGILINTLKNLLKIQNLFNLSMFGQYINLITLSFKLSLNHHFMSQYIDFLKQFQENE